MTKKYKVCLVGCGERGAFHAEGFQKNSDRFELVAVCDLNVERLNAFAKKFGIERTYTDAEQMLAEHLPDVFCFATLPNVRWSLVQLGIKYGVKAIAFEKPMALDLEEARRIAEACERAGVKAIVSHQQKYGPHWQEVKRIVDSGEIGEIHTIHATSKFWLAELGTHLTDYMIWYNGGTPIEWVVGHAHGIEKFAHSHPSADYVMGQYAFKNGVRGIIECGYLAPDHKEAKAVNQDNSITIYGTHGYARVITGGGWQALTKSSKGQVISGPGTFDPSYEQPLYLRDLADWLDDDAAVHSNNVARTYHGFEAVMALYISCLENRKVTLPLERLPSYSVMDRLKERLRQSGHIPTYSEYIKHIQIPFEINR